MVRLTKIYTRTGDDGTTGLGTGARVLKTDPRVEAYGTVDEANAFLGQAILACRANTQSNKAEPSVLARIATVLERCQHDLFDVGADLCTPLAETYAYPPLRVKEEWVDELEADCDTFLEPLEKLRSFILPSGTPGSAYLHLALTIVRRAERSTWAAIEAYGTEPGGGDGAGGVNPATARYLNRLSDLLFILARTANKDAGGDVLWQPGGGREQVPTRPGRPPAAPAEDDGEGA